MSLNKMEVRRLEQMMVDGRKRLTCDVLKELVQIFFSVPWSRPSAFLADLEPADCETSRTLEESVIAPFAACIIQVGGKFT